MVDMVRVAHKHQKIHHRRTRTFVVGQGFEIVFCCQTKKKKKKNNGRKHRVALSAVSL